jgi:hypothetical protein
MKLLGNSVSVPVIEVLAKAIVDTGVFDENEDKPTHKFPHKGALEEMVCENAV